MVLAISSIDAIVSSDEEAWICWAMRFGACVCWLQFWWKSGKFAQSGVGFLFSIANMTAPRNVLETVKMTK